MEGNTLYNKGQEPGTRSKEVGYLKEEVFFVGEFWLADLGGSRRSELMTLWKYGNVCRMEYRKEGEKKAE